MKSNKNVKDVKSFNYKKKGILFSILSPLLISSIIIPTVSLTSCGNNPSPGVQRNVEIESSFKDLVSLTASTDSNQNIEIILQSKDSHKLIDSILKIRVENNEIIYKKDWVYDSTSSKITIYKATLSAYSGTIYITPSLKDIDPSGIELSTHEINITVGDKYSISATLKYSNSDINWTVQQSSNIIYIPKTTTYSGEVLEITSLAVGSAKIIASCGSYKDECLVNIKEQPSPEITVFTSAVFSGDAKIDNQANINEVFTSSKWIVKGKINQGQEQTLTLNAHYKILDYNGTDITAKIIDQTYKAPATIGNYNYTIQAKSGSASSLKITLKIVDPSPTVVRTIKFDTSKISDFSTSLPTSTTSETPSIKFSASAISEARKGKFVFSYTSLKSTNATASTDTYEIPITGADNISIGLKNIFVTMKNASETEAIVSVSFEDTLYDIDSDGLLTMRKPALLKNENIVIPTYVNGTTVTGIAVEGCKGALAKSLTFEAPSNIKKFSANAFENCKNLTSFTIPSDITELPEYLFSGCSNIETFTFNEKIKTISSYCFNNCSKISNIIIPKTIEKVKSNAFANCANLSNVSIDQSLLTVLTDDLTELDTTDSSINASQLTDTTTPTAWGTLGIEVLLTIDSDGDISTTSVSSKKETLEIPEKINGQTVYGVDWVISSTKSLTFAVPDNIVRIHAISTDMTSFDLPKNVETLPYAAFGWCYYLRTFNIPSDSKLKELGDACFLWDNISSITLPASLEKICSSALAYNPIRTITIPANVKCIESEAFFNCKLTTVKIEKNSKLETIEDDVFEGNNDLTSISFGDTDSFWIQTKDSEKTLLDVSDPSVNATNFLHVSSTDPDNWGYTGLTKDSSAIKSANITYDASFADEGITLSESLCTKSVRNESSTEKISINYSAPATNIVGKLKILNKKDEEVYSKILIFNTSATTINIDLTDTEWNIIRPQDSLTISFERNLFDIDANGIVTMTEKAKTKTEAIEIPEKVLASTGNEITVTGIAENGCQNSQSENITFATPDNIRSIGASAFNGSAITSFEIPSNISEIFPNTFANCVNLENLTFADTSKIWIQIGDETDKTMLNISKPAKNAENFINVASGITGYNWGTTGIKQVSEATKTATIIFDQSSFSKVGLTIDESQSTSSIKYSTTTLELSLFYTSTTSGYGYIFLANDTEDLTGTLLYWSSQSTPVSTTLSLPSSSWAKIEPQAVLKVYYRNV